MTAEQVIRAAVVKVFFGFIYEELGFHMVDSMTLRRFCSSEKVVSIFEPHTDIIVKDRRDTLYGHKVCLAGGKSNLILDCVIVDGNPADTTLSCRYRV